MLQPLQENWFFIPLPADERIPRAFSRNWYQCINRLINACTTILRIVPFLYVLRNTHFYWIFGIDAYYFSKYSTLLQNFTNAMLICNRYWKIGEKIAILEEKVSAIFYVVWFVSLTFYDLVVPFLRTIGSPLGQKRVLHGKEGIEISFWRQQREGTFFRQLGPFWGRIWWLENKDVCLTK